MGCYRVTGEDLSANQTVIARRKLLLVVLLLNSDACEQFGRKPRNAVFLSTAFLSSSKLTRVLF